LGFSQSISLKEEAGVALPPLCFLDAAPWPSEWSAYGPEAYPTVLFNPWEKTMTDLLYLAGGVAVLLMFAAYAALLKRA
jgi:hypothetical protein